MKKILIIGGGFAGSRIAKALEKKFFVTLIDTKDYFEFTPSILRTIVEPKHINKVQVLHRHYLTRARIIVGHVTDISQNQVKIKNKKINFDYLVICSGSEYSMPIKQQDIVLATRANTLRDSFHKLEKAKRIVIIGGGLVGVELASEICTHFRFRDEVTIVHAKDRLIERNPISASNHAEKFLRKNDIKIIYNESVVSYKNKSFITSKGRVLKSDIGFWCTGIKPNFEFMKNHFAQSLNEKNQIKVNKYLQVQGFNNIFSAGDITNVSVEKTAQNSILQAQIVVKNIIAMEKKLPFKLYIPKLTPLVISLGKYNGIFVWKNFVFKGLFVAFMKYIVEKYQMFHYR